MRLLLMLLFVMLLATASASDYARRFQIFKEKFNRKYSTEVEEVYRYNIFVSNMKRAEMLQGLNPHAKFGENEFADLSEKEFKVRHNSEKFYAAKLNKSHPIQKLFSLEEIEATGSSIDWRQKGAVTAVKNQGQCGSCWAFSTTGSTEGQWFLAGHSLVSLSEQELVSCDHTCNACNGGLMDIAFEWLVSNQGGWITSEEDYPYTSGTGTDGICMLPKPKAAQVTGHKDLPHNEDQMATWMYTGGPISIGVDATSWQTYMGGIMTNCVSSQVDHGVLAVGFDDTNDPPYWIIKNSWGASWGEEGYIRVKKGTNQCLITNNPCVPTVAKGPGPGPGPSPGPTDGLTITTYDDAMCDLKYKTETVALDKCISYRLFATTFSCTSSGEVKVAQYIDSETKCVGEPIRRTYRQDECIDFLTGQNAQLKCPKNPGPGPGPGPSPSGSVTVKKCDTETCNVGCETKTVKEGECVQYDGFGTTFECTGGGKVKVTEFLAGISQKCTGTQLNFTYSENQCVIFYTGDYAELKCGN